MYHQPTKPNEVTEMATTTLPAGPVEFMGITIVKPITCRKCKGSGEYMMASGMPSHCGWCVGAGYVEGDKATNDANKRTRERNTAAHDAIRQSSEKWAIKNWAKTGLQALYVLDRDRWEKAVDSVLSGHPAVMAALAEYGETHHAEYLAHPRA